VTFAEAIDRVEELVRAKKGGSVYTPNVDHVCLFNEDPRFRAAYEATDLSLVDGMPVLWASKILGRGLPEKISGSDLVAPLAERAARLGWRVYLLGGGDGVAERAKAKLEELAPGVQIVGTSSPRVNLDESAESRAPVIESIRSTSPDLLFVALGSPKQESWIYEVRDALRPTVCIGVGASFDFIVGIQQRAPKWVASAGLEWAYRLSRDPKRLWRRYLVRDPKFALIVLNDLRGG
jgi:N-acetylglucosaminyldiphosphoundecaprenol N-acetyl-beta-D-mannosaminyltransferase